MSKGWVGLIPQVWPAVAGAGVNAEACGLLAGCAAAGAVTATGGPANAAVGNGETPWYGSHVAAGAGVPTLKGVLPMMMFFVVVLCGL